MASTTVIGNLAQAIELRYTNAGKAFASVTVAVNEKRFNKQTNQYEDGDTWFARGILWGEFAEHVHQSLDKGSRVIGHGRLKQRNFETKDGDKRSVVEIEFDAFGPDLRFATAQVTRAQQGGSGASSGAGANPWASGGGFGAQHAAQDSWAQPSEPQQFDGFSGEDGQPF